MQLNIVGRLHAGQSRKIVEGQKIHASVMFRPGYRPKAAYPGYPFADWPHQLDLNEPASHQRLKALGESESHWETDLFDLWPVDLLFCGIRPTTRAHRTPDRARRFSFILWFVCHFLVIAATLNGLIVPQKMEGMRYPNGSC